MKRIAFVMVLVLIVGVAKGQGQPIVVDGNQVINGVMYGSPKNFMYLPENPPAGGWNNSWVKPKRYDKGGDFISSSTGQSNLGSGGQLGAQTSGANYSHRFITTSDSSVNVSNDYCFRDQLDNNPYNMGILPLSWNSNLYVNETYETTVIQMGGFTTNRGQHAQEILYSFIPSIDTPVLMLHFAFNTEGAYHKTGGWQGGFAPRNPGVEFAVLEHGTNNYLQLGYYNNDGIHPYSQFWFGTPMGSDNEYTCCGSSDPRNTPSNKALIRVPYSNNCDCDCGPNSYDVHEICTFPYTIVAFDLSEQARNHQAVDFRVREWTCSANLHKANCYFTAKMIPAKLKVDYCKGDPFIKLTVPWGFDEDSYHWYNGADSASAQWFDPADFDNPAMVYEGSTSYVPKLIPNPAKPYFRCEVVSYTGVPFVYEATVDYYDLRPMFWAEPRATSDSVHKCGYSVLLHNESQIGVIVPNGNGGVDTNWQDLKTLIQLHPELCTWNFGDDTLEYHGFEPEHVYADTGTYIITLTITDTGRVCVSPEYYDTVRILKEFKEKHYARDTVVTCESKLPYHYKPELFGEQEPRTTWDIINAGEDSILVNYTWVTKDSLRIRSWNGCDSIVKVKFDVLTPMVLIQEAAGSDFCDSAKTLLETRVDNVSRPPVYVWTFMDSVIGTGSTLWAMSDGVYTVSIEDTTTGCTKDNTYKINSCVPNIFLPNCITPTTKAAEEGPVQNNYFYLDEFVLRFISEVKFMVYSRDGQQVYYYEGKKNPDGKFAPPTPFGNLPSEMDNRLVLWDGSVHGRIVDGTYTYALWIVSGGKSYLYKGRLMVM